MLGQIERGYMPAAMPVATRIALAYVRARHWLFAVALAALVWEIAGERWDVVQFGLSDQTFDVATHGLQLLWLTWCAALEVALFKRGRSRRV
jgi:hypothetical protein